MKHGSFRKAGEALNIDHSYLSYLLHGIKDNPSDDVLKKLGLRRRVIYERIEK